MGSGDGARRAVFSEAVGFGAGGLRKRGWVVDEGRVEWSGVEWSGEGSDD